MNKTVRRIKNSLLNNLSGNKYDNQLHLDAADLLIRQSRKIQGESVKVKRLIQENAELRDQVYNLTLYLQDALLTLDTSTINHDDKNHWYNAFMSTYDGMPGYNPKTLEVQHEIN